MCVDRLGDAKGRNEFVAMSLPQRHLNGRTSMRASILLAAAGSALALSACTYVERDRSPPAQSTLVVPQPVAPQATVVTPAQPAPVVTVRPAY
jgi:hypothetical protein